LRKKFFVLIFLLLFIFTSSVFATNVTTDELVKPEVLTSDIYVDSDTYNLNGKLDGNAFISSKDFVLFDSSVVNGNLFIASNKVTLKSNVVYSDVIAKDGNQSIDKIITHSTVNGNVFVVCEKFILEPGVEIQGDLYIIANKIDLQKSSIINGNLFACSNDISINGKIMNSVYAVSKNFNMNYFGAVYNDLRISSEKVALNSVIHRNSFIDATEITTTPDFLLYGNLEASSDSFNFSGEIDGNAIINSKELNFMTSEKDSSAKCLIKGNLDYSSSQELKIEDSIVKGETTYTTYKEETENTPSFNLKLFFIELVSFVIYILVVVLIFNLIAKKYKDKKHVIKVSNTFAALGIGLLSIIAVVIVSVLLILTNIGITLSFTLVFAYILMLFLAIPLFVLDIAKLLKEKLNIYLATSLISLGLFLISQIPFVGELIMCLFTIIGVGRIVLKFFEK